MGVFFLGNKLNSAPSFFKITIQSLKYFPQAQLALDSSLHLFWFDAHQRARTPEQEGCKGSSLGMHQRGSQGANFQEGAKRTVISFAVSLSNATRSPNHLSDNCLAAVQPSQSSSKLHPVLS